MKYDDLTLDPRSQADLLRRMEELAASYTPEWRFDRNDPDIGSTLALIYTGQMADNLRRMNQLPEKYHTEFSNQLGLTLKPAYPAAGVVSVNLLRGTVPGVALPRGTTLMADGPEGSSILFETTGDVYLTNARIVDIMSISGSRGQIHSLMGGPQPARLLEPEEEEAPAGAQDTDLPIPPFSLFEFEEPGMEKNAMLLYHRTVFGGGGGVPIQLRITAPEGDSLAESFADPNRWRWSYRGGAGLTPFDTVEAQDGLILLRREGDSLPVELDGTRYHFICLEALEPIRDSITVGGIWAASLGEPMPPESILHEGIELESEECMPFGETVSLFDQCYICDDQAFSQQDADVTLSFRLSSRRKLMRLTAQEEIDELRIIKPRFRTVQFNTASTSPQRVALEYYNGQAWRQLPGSNTWSALLDGTHSGEFQITFRCPADWSPVPVDGYEGRCLRLRVTQADNCYLLPCEHTMPVLHDVKLSYVYAGQWKQPQRLRTIRGTLTQDQSGALLSGKPIAAFAPLPYPEAALYLGFDRPLEGAPVSILFEVEENVTFHTEPVIFEYSSHSGFKQMKVIDHTRNFSGPGTVLFMPPSDFAPQEVEGVQRWWLRLRGRDSAVQGYHPLIRGVQINAVDIRNQQTQPEETFYVEMSVPNMTFPLTARNILSAQVFVSEMGQLSRRQMRQMLEERPQDVRAEYDFLGEITSFFVRWTEVDNFDRSNPSDRHYMIDRANNTLIFGDGVHVRIPQARRGIAILVRAVSCDGAGGNVPAGTINRFFSNVLYVENVTNPAATFAGSDLENLDSARRRGANLLNGRGRLVSELDFSRAVRAFSGMVEKVKCVAGRDIHGQPAPSLITIAIMTRDYNERTNSFHNIREPLRRLLLDQCDATLDPDCLVLSEPVYVSISLSVWVKADDASRTFDVQNMVLDSIHDFLNPLSHGDRRGWEIGVLPSERQLRMLLQSLRFQGRVSRMIVSARYVDRNGVHETGLDQLPYTPFSIGVSGEHHVYIEFQ